MQTLNLMLLHQAILNWVVVAEVLAKNRMNPVTTNNASAVEAFPSAMHGTYIGLDLRPADGSLTVESKFSFPIPD